MTHEDLTIVDVLKDPLIRLMMRADHVSVKTMKALLVYAAQKQGVGLGNRKHQHVAKNSSAKAHPVTYPRSGSTDAPLTVRYSANDIPRNGSSWTLPIKLNIT